MRDYKTCPVPTTPSSPDYLTDFVHQQVAGNQSAVGELSAVETDESFLDRFDFAAETTEVGTNNPLPSAGGGARPDEGLSDYSDLLEIPSTVAVGEATVGLRGGSMSRQRTDENPILGESTTRQTVSADLSKGTVGFASSYQAEGVEGTKKAQGIGVFLSAGVEGRVVAGVGGELGGVGASARGMVDFGESGELQNVGAGVSADLGVGSTEVEGAVQLGTVAIEGREVSRAFGSNAMGNVKAGPGRAGIGERWSYAESVSFTDEQQAKDYGRALAKGEHGRVADLTAAEVLALPDGARAEYVWQASMKAGGGFIGTAEAHGEGRQKVSIRRGTQDVIQLSVEEEGLAGLGGGISNGVLGTEGAVEAVGQARSTFEVDLSDPDQAVAFERFQQTGDRTGLVASEGEALTGDRSSSKAFGLGFEVKASTERMSGQRYDGEGVSDLERGGYVSEGESAWDTYGMLATVADCAGDFMSMLPVPEDAVQGYRTVEAWAEEQGAARFAEVGSRNGKDAGSTEVLTQRGDGATLALQEQLVDFDDQQENARFLEDQMDRWVDGPEVNGGILPSHKATERAWKLESVIAPSGMQNIEDVLASDGPFPCETVEALDVWAAARESYDADLGVRALIADTSTQGEDALECARAMAGEGEVEHFLSSEGDGVWMSREEHEALATELELDTKLLRIGDPTTLKKWSAKGDEIVQTLSKLKDRGMFPEIPGELRRDESRRLNSILSRIERLK